MGMASKMWPMPSFRVRLGEGVGAVIVETDTPEDAVRVQQVYTQTSRRLQSHVSSVRQLRTLFSPGPKTPARVIFKNGHYRVFPPLYDAGEKGLQTEFVAEILHIPGPKSLPPIVAAWGKRAKNIGLDLKELLEVDRGYANGKPSTIYRLTPKGREVFGPEKEQARIVDLTI